MRRSLLAVFILAVAACVDVPDSVRAEFAGPGAADRSNYRHGQHGSARPVDEPPVAKAAGGPVDEPAADAGASPTGVTTGIVVDGGVPSSEATTNGSDGGTP